MQSRWILGSLGLALVATALGAPEAQAAGGSLAGSFKLDLTKSDQVAAAIDRCLASVNPLIRMVAKGRLTETNKPYASVTIAIQGAKVSVQRPGAPVVSGPSNGSFFSWTREDGEKLEVSLKLTGTKHLVQTFKAKDGMRVNTFDLTEDGQDLRMAVRVSSDKLPQPLSYTLAYARQ